MFKPHTGSRQLEIRHHDTGQRSAAPRPQHRAAWLREVRRNTHLNCFFYAQTMSWPIPSQDPAAVSHSGGSLQGVQHPQGGSRWADGQVRRRGDLCGWHAFGEEDCVVTWRRDGDCSQGCRSSTSGKETQGGHPENQASCNFWRSGGDENVRLNCVESCFHFKPTMLFFPVLIIDQSFETFFSLSKVFFWMKEVNKTVTIQSVYVFEPTSIIPVFHIYIYLPTADHRIQLLNYYW